MLLLYPSRTSPLRFIFPSPLVPFRVLSFWWYYYVTYATQTIFWWSRRVWRWRSSRSTCYYKEEHLLWLDETAQKITRYLLTNVITLIFLCDPEQNFSWCSSPKMKIVRIRESKLNEMLISFSMFDLVPKCRGKYS